MLQTITYIQASYIYLYDKYVNYVFQRKVDTSGNHYMMASPREQLHFWFVKSQSFPIYLLLTVKTVHLVGFRYQILLLQGCLL